MTAGDKILKVRRDASRRMTAEESGIRHHAPGYGPGFPERRGGWFKTSWYLALVTWYLSFPP